MSLIRLVTIVVTLVRFGRLGKLVRHGKSCKHASRACGQFLRKLWTFLEIRQFMSVFPHKCALLYTIIPFLLEIMECIGKICN